MSLHSDMHAAIWTAQHQADSLLWRGTERGIRYQGEADGLRVALKLINLHGRVSLPSGSRWSDERGRAHLQRLRPPRREMRVRQPHAPQARGGEAMTTETISERVARGAAWLDTARPGWRDSISLDELDIADSDRCVCGQAFAAEAPASGGYFYAFTTPGIARGIDAQAHGFLWDPWQDFALQQAETEALTQEWRRVIHNTRVEAHA